MGSEIVSFSILPMLVLVYAVCLRVLRILAIRLELIGDRIGKVYAVHGFLIVIASFLSSFYLLSWGLNAHILKYLSIFHLPVTVITILVVMSPRHWWGLTRKCSQP